MSDHTAWQCECGVCGYISKHVATLSLSDLLQVNGACRMHKGNVVVVVAIDVLTVVVIVAAVVFCCCC